MEIVDPHDRPFAEFGHLSSFPFKIIYLFFNCWFTFLFIRLGATALRYRFGFDFDNEKEQNAKGKKKTETSANCKTGKNFRLSAQAITATSVIDTECKIRLFLRYSFKLFL